MEIFGQIIIFVIYVILIAVGTMWRCADAWAGISFGRRVFLAVSTSWKWWLIFSVALLIFDATAHYGRGVPTDLVLVVLAIVMALVFAILRNADSRKSHFNKRE